MAAQWQSRNRTKTGRSRWSNINQPQTTRERYEYRRVQVVDAALRGDQCYAGRVGFFWHVLDPEDSSIVLASVRGPFPTREDCWEDTYAGRSSMEPRRQRAAPAQRQLKDVGALRVVSVAVVNETPGSRREIPVGSISSEIRRMGGERLARALGAAGLGGAPA